MQRFIAAKLQQLVQVELCGYVCKKDSPSSGMARVKVYDKNGQAKHFGSTGSPTQQGVLDIQTWKSGEVAIVRDERGAVLDGQGCQVGVRNQRTADLS